MAVGIARLKRLVVLGLLVMVVGQVASAVAVADSPTPKPTPSPPPTPSSAAPAGSPTAPPAASPAPATVQFSPEEYARAQAVVQATSLLARIEAQRDLAKIERAFIDDRLALLRGQREELILRIAALQGEADERQRTLERIVVERYRQSQRSPFEVLLATGSILSAVVASDQLATLGEVERSTLVDVRRLQDELRTQRDELAANEARLAGLAESLTTKDAALAKLAAQAQRLSNGGGGAEVAVLRELVDVQLAASAKVDELIAQAAAAAGAAPLRTALSWVWPVRGPVAQEFGPSTLPLEPPRTYHGIAYPFFHDGLDIAAAIGTPVVAAAAGRVAFVGHLPDGAMVVLIAHDQGLFSLHAHLDDAHAPPPVKAGDLVTAGDVVGAVGLTGITTGAHLHFVIRRGDEPLDPRALLPSP